MPPSIFDDPRLLPSTAFKRQAKKMEYTDKADLSKILLNVLLDPQCGHRTPDGAYEIHFGDYALRYSLLDPDEPQTKISLDVLRVA